MNAETTIIAQAMADDAEHWREVAAQEIRQPTLANTFITHTSATQVSFTNLLRRHYEAEAVKRVGRRGPYAMLMAKALSQIDWETLARDWLEATDLSAEIRPHIPLIDRIITKLLPPRSSV